MSSELIALLITAAFIGSVHTLFGPDHYVPFIVMAKARKWSMLKTTWITFLCGIGHVLSSVVLGAIGIAAGISLTFLKDTESTRGEVAAWLLTSFGLLYFVWGVWRAIRNKPHTHRHAHLDGEHEHEHTHHEDHAHPHEHKNKPNMTPWVLFTIFVFGPCEPLIPLLMWPAAAESVWSVVLVVVTFSVVTLSTMMTVVLLSTFGLKFISFKWMERYSHALAGAMVLACGIMIHIGF